MAVKTFRFTGFSGGLYASANVFDQPQGTLARISNLMLSERGGLLTVDGSHAVVKPGSPTGPLAFASSGLVAAPQPPAPTISGTTTFAFSSTGGTTLGSSPVLPLTLTVNTPGGIIAGDLLIALIMSKGYAGNFGNLQNLTASGDWTVASIQGSGSAVLTIYYRVVNGMEAGSYTWSLPGTGFNGYGMDGMIIPIRGANTANPIETFNYRGQTVAGPSASAPSITTTHANDLILIWLTPISPGFGGTGAEVLTPGNVPGTTVLVNANQPVFGGGMLTDTVAAWATPFAGPGATGQFTSPSGWPPGAGVQELTLAIGASNPPAGQLMGFPITASGAIVPFPIIQGVATGLAAPQGSIITSAGKLWVADAASNVNGAIIAYSNPKLDNGNTAPDTVIQGPTNTLLANPSDVAVGASGKVYVANQNPAGTGQILIYAAGASGDVAPIAEIGGGTTTLSNPRSVAVDSSENVYVVEPGTNAIKVWHAGNTGNVAPDQIITGALTQIHSPLAVRIDPNGLLWITCGSPGGGSTEALLLQFNTTDNGNVAPTTKIDSPDLQPGAGFAGPTGLAFDTAANIYVAVLGNKKVYMFSKGSSGTPAAAATISGFPNGPFGVGVEQA